MHYFHMFLNVFLPVALGVGILGNAIAFLAPMESEAAFYFRKNFLQVHHGFWIELWSVYGITLAYIAAGVAVLLYTTWDFVGDMLIVMAIGWMVRSYLLEMFPQRAMSAKVVFGLT